jgi:uncharacterized protein (TIRG00374 family)
MAVALRGVDRTELARELTGAAYAWLLPAALFVVLGQIGRAFRWRLLFGSHARPSGSAAFAILSVGYLASIVLPLRLGDGLRAWLVETHSEGDGAAALATVIVERAVDLLTVFLLLGLWVPGPGVAFVHAHVDIGSWFTEAVFRAGIILAALSMYAGLALVGGLSDVVQRIVRRALEAARFEAGRIERLAQGTARFVAAFAVLRDPSLALGVLAVSIVVWWIGAASYWLVFQAFHIQLGMAAAVFAMSAAAVFAALLPPSPGYVGSFHTAIREALVLYTAQPGASAPQALSAATAAGYAIVLHAVTLVTLIALGAASIVFLGLGPSGEPREAV